MPCCTTSRSVWPCPESMALHEVWNIVLTNTAVMGQERTGHWVPVHVQYEVWSVFDLGGHATQKAWAGQSHYLLQCIDPTFVSAVMKHRAFSSK